MDDAFVPATCPIHQDFAAADPDTASGTLAVL
jgi:hypothetical protein